MFCFGLWRLGVQLCLAFLPSLFSCVSFPGDHIALHERDTQQQKSKIHVSRCSIALCSASGKKIGVTYSQIASTQFTHDYAQSWSITGFLSYLNPLRSRSPAESSDSLSSFDEEDESFESQVPSVAASLSAQAKQVHAQIHVHSGYHLI